MENEQSARSREAAEKAVLLSKLKAEVSRIPMSVRHGSVNITRDWLTVQKAAKKVSTSPKATLGDIQSALANLERYA